MGADQVVVVALPLGLRLGSDPGALGLADLRLNAARVEAAIVDLHLAHRALDERELVRRVGDGEALAVAKLVDVPTQDLETKRVEGADGEPLGVLGADQRPHPVAHLGRRLVGEGHGEDVVGRHALLDHIGDAVHDHPGLAAAGAGQHQERTFERLDRVALRGVELGEIEHARLHLPRNGGNRPGV